MPVGSHRIRPAWPDALVYEEGAERTLRFDCRSPEEPPVIGVPAAELWPQRVPAWARGERALILSRLRAAGCVLCEEGTTGQSLVSLDGALRVELERIDDDRTGPWESMRLIALPAGELLASTSSRGTPGIVRFPRAGCVQVAVTDRAGEPRMLHIDALARRFRFSLDAQSWPLSELDTQLGYGATAVAARTEARSLRSDLGTTLGSVILSAAGAWMVAVGETNKDRVLGMLCALFFAACAIVAWLPARK